MGQTSMLEPIFQQAVLADLDVLMPLMRELYAHDGLPFDASAGRAALQQILSHDHYGRVYLIQVAEATVGYLVITFGFSLEYGGRDAFLDEIYVRANERGRGVGQRSLVFAEALCRSEGIGALHLEVERRNAHAQTVYRKAGFVDHDRYLFTKYL